jgi:hypothetical protein
MAKRTFLEKKQYSLYFKKKNHKISPEIFLELFQHIFTLDFLKRGHFSY